MSPALSKDLINDQNEKKDAVLKGSNSNRGEEKKIDSSHLKKSGVLHQAMHSFYERLSSLNTLEPCQETNKIFHELVSFVVKESYLDGTFDVLLQSKNVDEICRKFHSICSAAESSLESHWATNIVAGHEDMTGFPYYDNYIQLTRLEYNLLRGQDSRPKHVMFIGNGPLPMSSLILAGQHLAVSWLNDEWSVMNVDISPDVNQLARQVSKKALSQHLHRLSFMTCDAAKIDATFVQHYDVIYLAALVGLDGAEKEAIVRHLAVNMKKGSRLLVRSAAGLRRLLYPQVSEQSILNAGEGRLVVEVICHPRNEVINSVIVARRV